MGIQETIDKVCYKMRVAATGALERMEVEMGKDRNWKII